MHTMRIVCLSDTHGRHAEIDVPDGDLVVVTGDFTKRGTREQVEAFDRWLGTLRHRHKVVIAGNHDFVLEERPEAARWLTNAVYLQDEGTTIEGVRIYGSPWQPRFFDWAFNLDRGAPLRAVWDRIPAHTDVLLTHGPPRGILDRTVRGEEVGCDDLREAVFRVRPRLHVFGHIHEAYGQVTLQGIRFVNAATCTAGYVPSHPPVVVDL